jgi:hypothetical protein
MLPIAPTSKPNGHTIVARIKKTPSSMLNKALTALCRRVKMGNPMKEASVNSKNFFKPGLICVFVVRTNSATPKPVRIIPTEIKKTYSVAVGTPSLTSESPKIKKIMTDMARMVTNARNIDQSILPFTSHLLLKRSRVDC